MIKVPINIQNVVAILPKNRGYGYLTSYEGENYKKSWKEGIIEHLHRSRCGIKENKIFDYNKVDKIEKQVERLNEDYKEILQGIER